MSEGRLSRRAQADIDSIYDYTVVRWGLVQAERYVGAIRLAIADVAVDPQLRSQPSEFSTHRRFRSGSHHIYFRRRGDGIFVVRILHERMDPSRHL